MALNQKILLVSPVQVLARLWQLLPQGEFWSAVGFSFLRITLGFLLACVVGTALGVLASRFRVVRDLCAPLMATVKSIPVASFIILVLVWVPSRNLSVVISFLMVAPIVYQNVLGGISNMDHKLTEMADVFQVPFARRLRYLYLPQVAPFFRSACAVGLGLCWKSGVAAEVIGLPDGSIGERLYEAKVYLDTPDLFAWTLVIVLVSIAFEKLFLFLLDRALYLVRRP
ncbi:MAG TPA: ABC transporter permease subunit [Candidatus Acutalibacter stercorigallinarum]|nr:ABC transporter permease subunit [Candidatus Acutalibacter stercorigallinarum]